MPTKKRVGVVLFLVLAVAAAAAVLLPGTDSQTVAANNTGLTAGESGMRVFIDPETGEVGGTPSADVTFVLDAEVQNAISKDYSDLPTIKNADGSESIDLQGRGQEASLVTIDANGSKKIVCVSHVEEAEKAMASTSTAPEVK